MEVQPREGSFFALMLSAFLAAAIIVIALQRPAIILIVLPVVLAAALIVGLPLYVIARSKGRVNAITAAIAGAITGAAMPMLVVFLAMSSAPGPAFEPGMVRFVGIFALLGAVMGLVFLLILQRGAASRPAQIRAGGAAAVLAVAGIGLFQFGVDHSCHNPGIRGVLAQYPARSIYLTLPEREWPALRGELVAFAKEKGWSVLDNPDGLDRTGVEICTLPATVIQAAPFDGAGETRRFTVDIEKTLENDDAEAPFEQLRKRIAARWPGAERDPSAPPSPSPTPSSAAR